MTAAPAFEPGGTPIDPSACFVAVTPSDTVKITYNNQPHRSKAIYVGGAGNLAIKDINGNTVLFQGLTASTVLPIQTDQIMATNTSASMYPVALL
jgi:hypothetical protein